jgi:AraC-like DNA-binding protein
LDLLTELLRRTDLRVEEPRVHTLAGPWAVELPRVPYVFLILRGCCTLWPEGERHSRGLSDGHLLLTSGAIRCVLHRFGARLDAAGPFDAHAGEPLHEPFFRPRSAESVQLLAAKVQWTLRPFEVLTPPPWVVTSPAALSLSHDRQPLREALGEELLIPRLGRTAAIQRLLEVLLIRALRAELVSGFWSVSGWLGALTDPVLRTALGDAPDLGSVDSVRALAVHSHRSIRRLSARVKSISGLRPRKLLSRLRIADALEALDQPAPGMRAIAHAAGFATVSSFCRAFRREVGCSPTEYWRRRHRRPFPRAAR